MIEIVRLNRECVDLVTSFFLKINTIEYRHNFSPFPFDSETAIRLCNYDGRDLYCAITKNSMEIIGIGMLRGWDEGFDIPSLGLCILENYQGIGLGKLMLQFLEISVKMSGCRKSMLKVRKDNEKARLLYSKEGYIFGNYDKDFLIGRKDLI